jgi:hypothetical protein
VLQILVVLGLALSQGVPAGGSTADQLPGFSCRPAHPRRWPKGVSQATVDSALTNIEPVTVVVSRDSRAAPELTPSLDRTTSPSG